MGSDCSPPKTERLERPAACTTFSTKETSLFKTNETRTNQPNPTHVGENTVWVRNQLRLSPTVSYSVTQTQSRSSNIKNCLQPVIQAKDAFWDSAVEQVPHRRRRSSFRSGELRGRVGRRPSSTWPPEDDATGWRPPATAAGRRPLATAVGWWPSSPWLLEEGASPPSRAAPRPPSTRLPRPPSNRGDGFGSPPLKIAVF
jgi:hypothetical protein